MIISNSSKKIIELALESWHLHVSGWTETTFVFLQVILGDILYFSINSYRLISHLCFVRTVMTIHQEETVIINGEFTNTGICILTVYFILFRIKNFLTSHEEKLIVYIFSVNVEILILMLFHFFEGLLRKLQYVYHLI